MALKQHITDFIELLGQYGVFQAVICPGSRNAPITIALNRNKRFNCYSVSDERSAAFIAMGMSLVSKKPTLMVCTSGSAAFNFAPAVAEAFFQEIPLIVITADRPKEWIHQNEGQTIFQHELYGKNVKKSLELIENNIGETNNWVVKRTAFESYYNCMKGPKGPVHINIPISEPFYPTDAEIVTPTPSLKAIEYQAKIYNNPLRDLYLEFKKSKSVGILIGQYDFNPENIAYIESILECKSVTIIGDITSNIPIYQIQNHDYFLDIENDKFKFDLLISLGKSHISKPLKNYFKKHKTIQHYHVQEGTHVIDPLQSITAVIDLNPNHFFSFLQELLTEYEETENDSIWHQKENLANQFIEEYWQNYDSQLTDLQAYQLISLYFGKVHSQWHLGNSMAVRYANLLFKKNSADFLQEIYCNRGTSGIDGSLSTAVGIAINQPQKLHTVLLGDVSFFYDRNALWNTILPHNLRLIVFNNAGGGIFRNIDGPSQQPELKPFFETEQPFSVETSVTSFGFKYQKVTTSDELKDVLIDFWDENATQNKCIEIFTNPELNETTFKDYLLQIRTALKD